MSDLGELGCGGRAPKMSAGYNNSIFQFNKFVDNAKILGEGIGPDKRFKYFKDCTAKDMANEQV